MMKKYIISSIVIVAFIFYSYSVRQSLNITAPTDIQILPTSSSSDTSGGNTNRTTIIPVNRSKDGVFTGEVADAFYGNIQVAAVIQSGKLVKVNILQYPNDRQRSVEINAHALPILQSEAIQSQSAMVDVVSGATDTSQAFTSSLGSALAKAGI